MSDIFWVGLRQLMMIGGTYLATKYGVDAATVGSTVDLVISAATGVTAAAGALWGLYVRLGTKAVLVKTAERVDVPTVSAMSGATEK